MFVRYIREGLCNKIAIWDLKILTNLFVNTEFTVGTCRSLIFIFNSFSADVSRRRGRITRHYRQFPRRQVDHPRQVALPSLRPRDRHSASHACHVRRKLPTSPRLRTRGSSSRRRRTGRKTEDHHRIPDAHDARLTRSRRARRVGHRRVHRLHAHHGGICYSQKESGLLKIVLKIPIQKNLN